ncbi:TetR-like C-terminal domain-containing protein [Geodermatophilus sp. DSM 44513]|uniref:TetR-like C-terminal domain-containing protein n=1 Tax=Geodermatophilus sp. DSM 44513 TaxID=1528104 RepID=UPI001278BDDB|nr:TetR-like C-terminal domain-containing protein [Geodermatophilus sp. DSM 44513]WNV75181.1 TetR-like C-terminal domain-containing protein [Geodermatophilus sp. DSM 44513]
MGRPRDPSRDDAIKVAALQVLAEAGYCGLTMDAVAAAAGVGKATIYRRWASKGDLLLSVIDDATADELARPDTGCLREDLLVLLHSLAEVLAGPSGRASRTLLGALHHEPTLAEVFRQGPLARWQEAFTEVIDRAVDRRELRPGTGAWMAAEAGPGILLQRWAVTGQPLDSAVVTVVVDEILLPLLRRR